MAITMGLGKITDSNNLPVVFSVLSNSLWILLYCIYIYIYIYSEETLWQINHFGVLVKKALANLYIEHLVI